MIQEWFNKLPDTLIFLVPFLGWVTKCFSAKRNESSSIRATIVSAQRNINEKHIRPDLIKLAQELEYCGYLKHCYKHLDISKTAYY